MAKDKAFKLMKLKGSVKEVKLDDGSVARVPTKVVDESFNGVTRTFTDKKGNNTVDLTFGQVVDTATLNPEILAWLQAGANGQVALVES